MKTIKLNNVEVSVAELEALGWTPPEVKENKGRFIPKDGQQFWVIGFSGDVFQMSNTGHPDAIALGNCYKTEEEAILTRGKQLAKIRIFDKLRELEGDWEADWSDTNQDKYSAYYDHCDNMFKAVYHYRCQDRGQEWYSTDQAWDWVIKNMEDDLKLIFDIE